MSRLKTTASNHAQRGAALISAMLVVTLVATLASVALWQQWKHVEVESAERHRVQASWLLNGALDWSRLILREDAMASGVTGNSGGGGSGGQSNPSTVAVVINVPASNGMNHNFMRIVG